MSIEKTFTLVPEATTPSIGRPPSTDADADTYGRDTYCVESLRPGHMASGKQLLAQRCFHRLCTPRYPRAGSLRGGELEQNFGLDLVGYVGSTDARELESMLPVRVKNELGKDPEVETVTVVAVREDLGAGRTGWTLTITIDAGDGPFDLVVAVSGVSIQLLGVT